MFHHAFQEYAVSVPAGSEAYLRGLAGLALWWEGQIVEPLLSGQQQLYIRIV
jgi:hypothetical protein